MADRKSGSPSSKSYDSSFLTPLNVGKRGADVGPDVMNPPVLAPEDPMGFIPGGSSKGSITNGK